MAATATLLRGGRVVDPAQGLDGLYDVRVRDGRIDAVGPNLAADDATVVDASGLLVVPGLIDPHVHCFKGMGMHATDPDLLGVTRGVTTVVDAGTTGHSTFPVFHDYVIAQAQTRVLAYLNLSTLGAVVGPQFSNLGDPRLIDPDGIAAAVEGYRDRIVGIKWMATGNALGSLGLEPLRRGRALADELRLPTLVHIGESWGGDAPPLPVERVVELLRPGDVVTHMFTSHPGGLLDASGKLQPAVREARARGVRFDIGHGMHNFSFDVARRLLDQDFLPDMVSTDGHRLNLHGPVYDQPTTMAKLMALGVPLADVVAMATSHAAELLGRSDELGSLAVGRVADVTLLRLEERDWTAVDSRRQELPAHQQLVPVLALRAGEVIEPRPSDAP